MPPATAQGTVAQSSLAVANARERPIVVHLSEATLLATIAGLAAATACALLALQNITWLAGTFAFLVLAGIGAWSWTARCITVDSTGIVVGRMVGLDRKLLYRDIARVHFIHHKTGKTDKDWKVDRVVQNLGVPFETPPPLPNTVRPSLHLRIEPTQASGRREIRIDLGTLHSAADIAVLHRHLPQGKPWL